MSRLRSASRVVRRLFQRAGTTPLVETRRIQLQLEALETRLAPVIGANAIPTAVAPGTGFDGVVKLEMAGVGSCTGSLLNSGRHILTAAHCLTDGSGNFNSPSTNVFFQLPGKTITMTVPQSGYWTHAAWNGNAMAGNDIAVLRLPALAPSGPAGVGADRYPLQMPTDEIGQNFRVVGYGRTGTGLTGNSGASGTKRAGSNNWTANANILRNEVQAITRIGNPTGGTFTLTFNGQTTWALGPNASAAAVHVALLSLSSIPDGAVHVEGGPALNLPWFVSFQGALANTNVSQITAADTFTPSGSIAVATRFQGGTNTPANGALVYDFDNGQSRNDALGLLHNQSNLGLGGFEASQSQGDSGGPAFLDNRISGVVSYSLPVNPGSPPDIDGVANNSFGELGVMTRVSSFATTLTTQLNAVYAFVLDMAFQHAGNNGVADTIEVQRFGSALRLLVNGNQIHFDNFTDMTTITIRGSNDRDVIIVSGDLADQVSVQGGAGNDELIVTGTSANDTMTVSSADVTLGTTDVNYSGVETVRVRSGLGNDTITVQSTSSLAPVTVEMGAGNDAVVVSAFATLAGGLTVIGQGGMDLLSVHDPSGTGNTFSITSTTVARTGSAGISYSELFALELDMGVSNDAITLSAVGGAQVTVFGSDGNDTFTVLGTLAGAVVGLHGLAGNDTFTVRSAAVGAQVLVYGGNDDDTMQVGNAANSLDQLLGSVSVNGGTGADMLEIRDQGTADGRTYTVNATTVSRTGAGAISYATLEELMLNAGLGDDTINANDVPATVRAAVDAGGGNDDVFVGPLMAAFELPFNVDGGAGTDRLFITDNLPGGSWYWVTGRSVFGGAAPTTINYSLMEALDFTTAGGADTITVYGTASFAPVTVRAGAGNDTINLGHPDVGLDAFGSPLTLDAGTGTDAVILNDQPAAVGQSYGFNVGTVTRQGLLLNHGGVESISLNATPFDDTITVFGNAAGLTVTVNAGAGSDTLTGNAVGNVFVLTGPDAGMLNQTTRFSSVENLLGQGGADRFGFANDLAVLTGWVNGGGGADALDYSALNSGIYAILFALAVSGVSTYTVNVENVIGSAGGDFITGDAEANVLIGGPGGDWVEGREGRDVVIGGTGADLVYGSSGFDTLPDDEDVLISGATPYDRDVTALSAIRAVWSGAGDYAARVAQLTDGAFSHPLNEQTLVSDGEADLLAGGVGMLDWFILDGQDGILDPEHGEVATYLV